MAFTFKLKSRQIDTITAGAMQTLVDFFYPIGSFYVQYPDANNNTASTAFPTTKYPATLLGGTWTAQWNTVPTFFSAQGDFHASEAETAGRTDGLQTGQIFEHLHLPASSFYRYTGVGSFTLGSDVGANDDAVAIGKVLSDGTHTSLASGYANRPQNRLFIIWKRTS